MNICMNDGIKLYFIASLYDKENIKVSFQFKIQNVWISAKLNLKKKRSQTFEFWRKRNETKSDTQVKCLSLLAYIFCSVSRMMEKIC